MEKEPEPNHLLRNARTQHHWTQQHLASELKVSNDTIRAWEHGRRSPSLEQRAKLCALFAARPEELGLDAPDHTSLETLSLTTEERMKLRLERVNRRRMLTRVRNTWIDGVLQESFQGTDLLELGLEEHPEALTNPWRLAVQETSLPVHTLPVGTTVVQMYDIADGELLLLGEPGAGKTTLLLGLLRTLLMRAEQNNLYPIPVIFHLSSWSVRQAPFGEWLTGELEEKYHVPRELANEWLQAEQIALLLDGLDEVVAEARLACMKAMNAYQQMHVGLSLVLCCRRKEYFALATCCTLQRAVQILPLTREQIDAYFVRAGEQFASVRHTLDADPQLYEMIETPLMLNTVTLAYEGNDNTKLIFSASQSKEERWQIIFQTYIERMLKRRSVATYSPSQAAHQLSWLARQMRTHGQTAFYLEQMQPDWLPDGRFSRRYRLAVIRWVLGITALVKAGLMACFRGDSFPQQPGLFFWVGGGKGNSVLGWMAPGLGGWLQGATSMLIIYALVTILVAVLGDLRHIPLIKRKAILQGIWHGLRTGILVALVFSVGAGLLYWRAGGSGVLHGIEDGLFAGFIFGLQRGLVALLRSEPGGKFDKKPSLTISRRHRLLNSVLFGLCAFTGFTGLYAWQAGSLDRLMLLYGLVIGCLYGVIYGVSYGTVRFYDRNLLIQPAEAANWSWLAVWKLLGATLKKGLLLAGAILIFAVVAITGASSLSYGWQYGFRYGLVYGSIVGLISLVAALVLGMLTSGWSSAVLEDRRSLLRPNEGIRRSLRHALFAACLFGPVGGISSGLVSALAFGISGIHAWYVLGLGFAIIFTLTFALEFFTIYGGVAVVEHYLLRWYLWRARLIPWNYVAFLDDASERILLCKRGEGYLFVHQLLLDSFARQEVSWQKQVKPSQEEETCHQEERRR